MQSRRSYRQFKIFLRFSIAVLYLAELHNSLPKMVVDILAEKLEREYNLGASKMLMKVNGRRDHASSIDQDHVVTTRKEVEKKKAYENADLPKLWQAQDISKVWYRFLFIQCFKKKSGCIYFILEVTTFLF